MCRQQLCAGHVRAFLEPGGIQRRIMQCVDQGRWVPYGKALNGRKTKDFLGQYVFTSKKSYFNLVFCIKRNILTWKKETQGVTRVLHFCPEQDVRSPYSLSMWNASRTPLSFCESYSCKVKLSSEEFCLSSTFLAHIQSGITTVFIIFYSQLEHWLWLFFLTTALKMAQNLLF